MANRTIYSLFGLCIVAFALVGLLVPNPVTQKVFEIGSKFTSPLWRSVGWVQEKTERANLSLQTLEQLEKEVKKLRSENSQLMAENSSLQFLKEENVRLREQLGFKQSSSFELLACRVIDRDASNWWSAVIINRGYKDSPKLEADQPVITSRGVVGKTSVVGPYTTRVVLLVDENCKVSSEVEGSRARGILEGASLFSQGDPVCKIRFVSRDTPMQIGARVFTSGLGGTFPPGLFLGTVKEAPPLSGDRNFGLFRDATVDPSVNLEDLKEVFVLVGVKQ